MKPAPFDYHQPETVDAAVDALTENGDATILAGGQSLIPMMNSRLATPDVVVDINGLSDLEYIREEDGTLAIGALTRQATAEQSDVVAEHCPLMAEALAYVGHKPIRHRGTIGGNLAHSGPTSELPAVARVLDAEFVVRGRDGERHVPAEDFFVGYMTTDVGDDELLTEIRIPPWPTGHGWSFEETAPRKGDYAIVGVAATLRVVDGTCEEARLAYTAVSDGPVRVPEAEDAVVGEAADEDTFTAAGSVAREEIDPPADVHGSTAYRENLVETLTVRALGRATERSGGD